MLLVLFGNASALHEGAIATGKGQKVLHTRVLALVGERGLTDHAIPARLKEARGFGFLLSAGTESTYVALSPNLFLLLLQNPTILAAVVNGIEQVQEVGRAGIDAGGRV